MGFVFTVDGVAKPKGSMRHVGRGRMVEQVRGSKPWREAVSWHARQALNRQGGQPLTGPVRVEIEVRIPRPRSNRDERPIKRGTGDIDKLARNILDALEDAGCIKDDAQVVSLIARKVYTSIDGSTLIVVGRA